MCVFWFLVGISLFVFKPNGSSKHCFESDSHQVGRAHSRDVPVWCGHPAQLLFQALAFPHTLWWTKEEPQFGAWARPRWWSRTCFAGGPSWCLCRRDRSVGFADFCSESLGKVNATPIAAGKIGSLCWCLGQRVQLHEPVPARQEQSSSTNKKFFLLSLSGQKILSQISLRQRLNSALSACSFNSAFCTLFKIVVESTKLVLPLEKINPRIMKAGTNKLQQCFVSAQVCSEQDAQSQWGRGVGIKTSFRPSPHLHHQFRVQVLSHNCPCWFAPGTALTYVSTIQGAAFPITLWLS